MEIKCPRCGENLMEVIISKIKESLTQSIVGILQNEKNARKNVETSKEEKTQIGLMSIAEASKYFGINRSTLQRYASERKIPIVRIGGRLYIDPKDFQQWIDRHRIGPFQKGARGKGFV